MIKKIMKKAVKKTMKKPVKTKAAKAKTTAAKAKSTATKAKTTAQALKRGRPKKQVKYTKTINVRLTQHQWVQVITWAEKAHLEPSVYIRKILLDFLNIKPEDR